LFSVFSSSSAVRILTSVLISWSIVDKHSHFYFLKYHI
jgi:hypothetical protein